MTIEVNTAVVMAGGKGKRIGGKKHTLKISGRSMISHITGSLEELFDRIIISGNIGNTAAYKQIEDEIPGRGPLGGIYSCLKHTQDKNVFFAACDMPLLNKEIIEVILNSPEKHDAYVPVISGNYEPLCAVYSHSCLPVLEEIVEANCPIRKLLDAVDTYYIKEKKFKKIEGYREMFFNVNTKKQLEKVRKLKGRENFESQSQ